LAPTESGHRRTDDAEIVVMIDGAHIRAVPGHQSRRLDVTVGKVETAGRPPRRFALAPMGAEQPAQAVRAALIEQGWRLGRPVTVISDGEPAPPNLVCAAKEGPVRHILDWWHISKRARHIEQALAGIYALRPTYQAGLDYVSTDVERLGQLIWNGYAAEAGKALGALTHLASEAIYLNGEHIGPAVRRLLLHCQELRAYLANNESALSTTARVIGQDGQFRLRAPKKWSTRSPIREWPSASECAAHPGVRTALPRCALPP
jgi:hypothetical protein